MALTERNRNALYQGLTRTIEDEEAVEAMLSQFPARDQDEPATKEHVSAEVARLDQRMTIGFAELDRRMTEGLAAADQRMTIGFAEVDRRFAELDRRTTEGLAAVDDRVTRLEARVDIGFARVDARFADMTRELTEAVHTEMRHWFLWSYGAMFVLLAAVVTAAKILE